MSFFLRRLHNHAEAEDLTQEVFIRLVRSDARVEMAQAYIFQTAANLLRDRARALKTRSDYARALGDSKDADIDVLDPDRVLEGRDAVARLAAALKELPDRTRRIVILYRLENMNRIAIASTFGISVSAVEKHLARGMAHLTRRMEAGA